MRLLPPPDLSDSDIERFWRRVTKTNDCWYWSSSGRGSFNLNGRGYGATAISWLLHTGTYPDKFLCHRCDHPNCVRPDHLFEGSPKDNSQDMLAKGRGGQGRHPHLPPVPGSTRSPAHRNIESPNAFKAVEFRKWLTSGKGR